MVNSHPGAAAGRPDEGASVEQAASVMRALRARSPWNSASVCREGGLIAGLGVVTCDTSGSDFSPPPIPRYFFFFF